ncbi:MAG: iron-containing alcohol dehydrogenase [Muribaculaceae bacterium]|nr:iron-containing alcohol dehydrogenase [Muribaculaceae bacterium]
MENFSFYSPTLVEFGRGAEEKVGMLTFLTGATKVMIVYGKKYARTTGLLDRVENSLNTIGIDYVELGGVEANPTDTLVYEGIKKARTAHVDGLIAIGGGSAIDTAKAIAAGVPYKGDFWDFFTGKATISEALPIGVVLTIPGSGSEGSGSAVITGGEGHQKLSVRTDSILKPRFAIMNPEMTATLTARQTAIGVMDAMTHILERYFSPTSRVEMTDRLCEGLIMGLMAETPRVLADPSDYKGRANLEQAAHLAHNGILGCGRTEDWTSHYLEHEISALYPQVAHGDGMAVVVSAYLGYMAHHKPSKVAQLGRRIFGVDEKDDRVAAIETVAHFKAFLSVVLRMPQTFEDLGIENPDIKTLTDNLHANKGETIGAYCTITPKDTISIYELMLSDAQRERLVQTIARPAEEPAAAV